MGNVDSYGYSLNRNIYYHYGKPCTIYANSKINYRHNRFYYYVNWHSLGRTAFYTANYR